MLWSMGSRNISSRPTMATVHQYAQKFISEEGKQNGLYWKVAEGQPESPIGPLVAYATGAGLWRQTRHSAALPRLLLSAS